MVIGLAVFMVLTLTQYAEVEAQKQKRIIDEVVQCVMDTLPVDFLAGGDLYKKKYMKNISPQWDPFNPHDYLMWPVYDGPEAWAASCHFSSTLKQCLKPLKEAGIESLPMASHANDFIIPALYLITLCEHQSVLTDPRTNNAECVHKRMLSDDVLRCSGLMSWFTGNQFLIRNINYPYQQERWYSNFLSSIFECIYNRGNWRHSCGFEVEAMMGNLTKSFSSLVKIHPVSAKFTMLEYNLCDVCKPGSNLFLYDKLNDLRISLLDLLIYQSQSPYLFRQCKEVNYPLNQCHLRLIWRRDVYAMFCHQVRSVIIPEFVPYLPFCDFGKYIRSAVRICYMGYDRFMSTSSHIARCTKDQDELFPCYKGLHLGPLSWGLISAGRGWMGDASGMVLESILHTVYKKIKTCVPRLYDHLRQTCRHGPAVVQLIQDLRVVLMIDAPAISSSGPLWHLTHSYQKPEMQVNQC